MAYTTFDELQTEIVDELKIELPQSLGVMPDDAVIALKVKEAIREAKSERNYPDIYTDEMILSDMERIYANIKAKAFFKCVTIGGEYQASISDNGISRTFSEYEKLSNGILPIARVC